VRALIRSELLKQRSTRTTLGLFAALVGLVLLAVVLHGLLPAEDLSSESTQSMILGRGEFLSALFAGLLGAMSVTAEIRHGTIRPTFIVSPQRTRVVAAKVWVSVLIGTAFGLVAGGLAVAVGSAVLEARGVEILLDAGDLTMLVVGSAAAAALWAAIGVGVGSVVRNQVPALVGICAWLLFVEGLLAGDLLGLGTIGQFLPGMAAAAISGQEPDTLLAPGVGLALLVGYAVGAALIGAVAVSRHEIE
jgi:ABC-type transport system involved in multi-copper enzyme maturation permease subunit